MPHWTTGEHKCIRKMLERGISRQEVSQAFPRHTQGAVDSQFHLLNIRFGPNYKGCIGWLRKAHEHYAMLEQQWPEAYCYRVKSPPIQMN